MYRLLVVCSLALACGAAPQFRGDPATAAILAETRQLRLDGSSDVAYAQEDGVLVKETTSHDGERRGSYEFPGDDGKLYRIEYTAGAGGFQVVSSTHVDVTPDLPTGPDPLQTPPSPRPVYRAQPTYRAPTQRPRVAANTVDFQYEFGRPLAAPVATITTTQRTVRKNFHTGQISLRQDGAGYEYTYTHNV